MSNNQPSSHSTRRLYRSETDKMIAGVAGGLGDYLGIDSTLIRLLFVLLTVFGGSGILIYIILWIVIPTRSSVGQDSHETIRQNAKEVEDKARNIAKDAEAFSQQTNASIWFGVVLVVFGLSLLFSNLGVISFRLLWNFWPLILVAIGIGLMFKVNRRVK